MADVKAEESKGKDNFVCSFKKLSQKRQPRKQRLELKKKYGQTLKQNNRAFKRLRKNSASI